MAFVQFSKVSLAFGDRDILKEVSINLASGTKAALAGTNGSGKTTLMKVLAGITPCDTGDRAVQKNTRIGYLPRPASFTRAVRCVKKLTELFPSVMTFLMRWMPSAMNLQKSF